jgi:hypothetical protein
MQAYQYFVNWLRIAYPGDTVDDFLKRLSDSGLSSEAERLGNALFGMGHGLRWDGKQMARLLGEHHKVRTASLATNRKLMKLNP